VFTVAASHTIGYHHKPIVLYNINGFWDSLIALLNDLSERGMVRGRWRDYILTASTLEELVALFK
jgi:predicted Rossmann-fold nucleotide-binding protein